MGTLSQKLTREKILAHRLLLKEYAPYVYQYMQTKHPLPELEEKTDTTKDIGGAETHQVEQSTFGNTATDRPTERK